MVQGRLEILLGPPPTGPAPPKQALCTGMPSVRMKPLMISTIPPCSWLLYVFSTMHCSLLPSLSKAASRVRVAPISPAKIIQLPSTHVHHAVAAHLTP